MRNFMKDYPSLLVKKDISKDELAKNIEDAKRGDSDTLAKLCEYVYTKIYSYIYYRVNHHEDAEDLTSEVVLKVVKALKTQKGNFHAWIYKIATNAVIDFYRRSSLHSNVSLSEMNYEIPDKSTNFVERMLTQDSLSKALSNLTEKQSQVVILKFIEGYSNEEIAKIIGKSVGAVKLLQFRALKSLREYFSEEGL